MDDDDLEIYLERWTEKAVIEMIKIGMIKLPWDPTNEEYATLLMCFALDLTATEAAEAMLEVVNKQQ